MVNGPPCPSCGWTLRWVPEQNAWGCDRCRTMHAAQAAAVPQAAPQSASQPQALAVPAISPAGGSFGGSAASSSPAGARAPSQPPGVYTVPQQQRAHSPSQQGFQQARPQSSSQPNYAYGQQPPNAPNAQPPNPYAPQPYVQQAPVSHAGGSYPTAQPASQPAPAGGYPNAQGGQYPNAQQPGGPYPIAQPGGSHPNAQQSPGGSYPGGQPAGGSYPGHPRAATGPNDSHAHPRAGSQAGAPPAYGPGGYPIHSREPDSMLAPEPPAPPKKSKRGLIIGVVAVGAIGAGIAVAVAMSGSKGPKGGADSKDVVAADTLAALAKGDVDGLVALMAPVDSDMVSCTEEAAKDRDPAKLLAAMRDGMKRTAEKAKGVEIELVKLGTAKSTTMEKGKEVAKGCTLTTEMALHDHELVLKVKKGGPAKERTSRISLMEVDGRWYLSNPPKVERPGDCATAAKTSVKNNEAEWKKSTLGDAAKARLEKAMTQHCSDDGWSDETITCLEEAGSGGSDRACVGQLTTTQLDKLKKKLEQIVLEDVKSREPPTIAETPPPPGIDPTVEPSAGSGSGSAIGAGSGSGSAVPSDGPEELPPICDDYKAEIDKLAGCRRIKADIRKGQVEIYDKMVDGWNRITKKTDTVRTSFETICKKGVESLVDLRKTLCR